MKLRVTRLPQTALISNPANGRLSALEGFSPAHALQAAAELASNASDIREIGNLLNALARVLPV
jgi:hypothetical protein